jgi:hypothetical protein
MMYPTYSQPCAPFNCEVQTRSLNDDITASIFTDTEQKLRRLGLDPAAYPGEVANSAVKLFESLRRRDVTAEQTLRSYARATWTARQLCAARGFVVTFGRHKGKAVGECPPSYLKWALKNCDDMPHNLRRAMQIVVNHGTSPKA